MTLDNRQLWLRLFLPFAAGYFLSYLYRTANAVIGPVLARDLGLGDNALGLLTSTYFLAFGAAQLPLGMLLDRFGPRRVEAALLLIAAALAVSESAWGQQVSAAIIGKVVDPSEAPLAGAKVTATDIARGTVLTTETNIEGFYNLPRVPVGSYEIRVRAVRKEPDGSMTPSAWCSSLDPQCARLKDGTPGQFKVQWKPSSPLGPFIIK